MAARFPGFNLKEVYKLPLFFLLLNAAFASWQTLFNVYLDSIGFSSIRIGTLNAIFIATSALVVPFWGMLADKHGNYRIFMILTSACALMVIIIGKTLTFQWMALSILMISVFHQPSGAVVDGMTLGFVRNNPSFTYGKFRLWGSVGWASGSLLIGYIAGKDISRIFTTAAILFIVLSLVNLFTLPEKPVTGRSLVKLKSFGVFFKERNMFLFLMIIFIAGIAVTPLHQFINLYYNDIGASHSFVGIVFFVQAIFEIPSFILAASLLKKMKAEKIILISLAVSMLRMLGYGLISNPGYAIILSAFHGFSISFFLIGVVDFIQERTPDHLQTTGQAMIWAFHFGAGITIGNLILGIIRDHLDMQTGMLIHSGFALLVLLSALFYFRRLTRKNKEV